MSITNIYNQTTHWQVYKKNTLDNQMLMLFDILSKTKKNPFY